MTANVLLAAAIGLTCYVLWPFLHAIVFAALLAAVSRGIRARLLAWTGGRETLSALLAVLFVMVAIVIPVGVFALMAASKGLEGARQLAAWATEENLAKVINHPWVGWTLTHVEEFVSLEELKAGLQTEALAISRGVGQRLLAIGATFFGNAADMLGQMLLMAFTLFYFTRDGDRMLATLRSVSPLDHASEVRVLAKLKAVAESILYGGVVTGVCQGVAGAMGLWIAGISPLFWGVMMFFASFIPVAGTALIWAPLAIWLLATGHTGPALFLAIWSAVLVGSIDNFLRPYLMRGKADMPPFALFLSIVGGVAVFGVKGVAYGPLIVGFAAVMLAIRADEAAAEVRAEQNRTGQLLD